MPTANGAWVLERAAFIASQYDRNAKCDVLYNRTPTFHLCGLIERSASIPKSGSTHRRTLGSAVMDEAKALFCKAHSVAHPQVWEWEERRTCEDVRLALLHAYAVEQARHRDTAGCNVPTDCVRSA